MNAARVGFFTGLCILCCAWSMLAIMGQSARFSHRGLVDDLRHAEGKASNALLDAVIAHDRMIMGMVPCNMPLANELALLLAEKADRGLGTEQEDARMQEMQTALAARLACMPTDGKAWLDYAMLSSYRAGITKQAIAAYEMSARVAPGESWLAQKRLLFALSFRAVFNDKAKAVAVNDILVLRRAHPNRMSAVLQAAQVKTPEELAGLFTRDEGTQ